MKGLLLFAATAAVTSAVDSQFWKQWGDGQAEVATYDLSISRYGAPRKGTAVTIFVTEPFSKSARVKADPGKHPPSDEVPVMKLNLIKDFQTGIYDYHDMTSVFAGVNDGRTLKVTFSGQEWCGHVWQQMLFDPGSVRYTGHSYFDGEADWSSKLDLPGDGIAEDALFHWARGMAEPRLQPGETRKIRMLTSTERSRKEHKPAGVVGATLERGKAAGATETYKAVIDGGLTKSFTVETAGQRRILEWKFSNGESGKLIASERLKYWELNQPGGEQFLRRLKVSPRPPRTM